MCHPGLRKRDNVILYCEINKIWQYFWSIEYDFLIKTSFYIFPQIFDEVNANI
jgi:hypothetical protein